MIHYYYLGCEDSKHNKKGSISLDEMSIDKITCTECLKNRIRHFGDDGSGAFQAKFHKRLKELFDIQVNSLINSRDNE